MENLQNPLERLEQLLTGQQSFGGYNETEFVNEEEVIQTEVVGETTEEMVQQKEGVPAVETLGDEEEALLSVQRSWELNDGIKPLTVNELFADADEIKKAVIYSEIFTRKYT